VTLHNRKSYSATIVGTDPAHDLAVIQIKAPDLVPAVLGDSRNLQVGQKVYAIGNPFGLSGTMTRGIVSSIRSVREPNGAMIDEAIQTDAAINPGNSGGPLMNWHGDVIGINTMILSSVSQNAGIGFAIPINTAKAVLNDLLTLGRVRRPALGVRTIPIRPELADEIGYPVILKASAGGGGRGMRVVNKADDLARAFQAAQAEAKSTFGHDGVYLERYFLEPRHIEVQVIADHRGHVVHLGERDCSVQRRHQKLLEETPSPAVDEKLRKEIGRVAVEAVKAVHYRNVGTVEFLLDKDHNFFFMEVNTRIQVEHPITEMVTGIDLIKEQIRLANGQALSFKQQDIRLNGHSLECRINAEDPDKFTPSPGLITKYNPPGGFGVRVDSAMESNVVVAPHYDSMIAKVITHGRDRQEAIVRMRRALDEFVIEGIKTTIPLHRRILNDPDFQKGHVSTTFLERFLAG